MRKPFFRSLLLAAAALACFGSAAAGAAEAYPSRPIELVVPYAPGGASDIIVRALAPHLQKELGGNIVVTNRAGANTAIAGMAVSHAKPDGYTLMLADVALLLNAVVLSRSPGYDVEKDFTHVSLIGSAPLVLFTPYSGARTLAEFLAAGKQKGLNIANAGPGSLGHMAAELLQLRTATTIVSVPYRGSGPALNETMAGQVDATFTSTASGMPLVKTERLRALAIASPVPSKDYPEIPTFEQLGIRDVNVLNWWGVIAPAGVPPEIVDKVAKALKVAVSVPEMRERFTALGITPSIRPKQEFTELIRSDVAQWRLVVKEAGIKID